MPSTQEKKKLFERDGLDLYGAGEPLGEPAPPPRLGVEGRAQLPQALEGEKTRVPTL